MSLKCLLLIAIEVSAAVYDIPPRLLYGLVETESDFRVNEVSDSGDVGPAQVNPRWWSEIGYNLNNPFQNIMAAGHILDKYRDRCGSIDCAIRGYNKGITRVVDNDQAGMQYLKKVKSNAGKYTKSWKQVGCTDFQ